MTAVTIAPPAPTAAWGRLRWAIRDGWLVAQRDMAHWVREPQLIAAIAAARAKHVTREARGMQAHDHRSRPVWLANDDCNRIVAGRSSEYDEARLHARGERHARFTGDCERADQRATESGHRIRVNCNERGRAA